MIIKDFEFNKNLVLDINVNIELYKGDPSVGCQDTVDFYVETFRNQTCSSCGFKKHENPEWKEPSLAFWRLLNAAIEKWYYKLNKFEEEALFE